MSLQAYRELALADEGKKEHLYAISSDGDHLEGEKKRLNDQHNSLTKLFGKKLILAPASFVEGDRILDCGTGTGIWAKDVANAFPMVAVEGADISRRFFPPPGEIPTVTFHNLSTLDLPAEWENRFKLVNQRLMVGCFNRVQWQTALQEIHRILKPGGWVQLVEIQHNHEFSATHPKYQRLLDITYPMMRTRGFILDTGGEVEEMVRQTGFRNVIRTQIPMPIGEWRGEGGRDALNFVQGAYVGMKGAVLQAGTVESGEAFDRVIKEAFDECNEIPGLSHDMEIIYGQKVI